MNRGISLVLGLGAAAALVLLKRDITTDARGVRRFTRDASKKIMAGLAGASFEPASGGATPGVFLMRVVANNGEGIPAQAMVRESLARGAIVVASDHAPSLPNAKSNVFVAVGETNALAMATGSQSRMAVVQP